MNKVKKRRSFIAQILLVFSILIIITVVSLYFLFSSISSRSLLEQQKKNIGKMLEYSDHQISLIIDSIDKISLRMMVDSGLYEMMSQLKSKREKSFAHFSDNIIRQLALMMHDNKGIVDVSIHYNGFSYAYHSDVIVKYAAIKDSEYWHEIQQEKGSIMFFPPDSGRFIIDPASEKKGYIWMARVMNMTDLEHFEQSFSDVENKPVLIVVLEPEIFSEVVLNNISTPKARYSLLDSDGLQLSIPVGIPEAGLQRFSEVTQIQQVEGSFDVGNTLYSYRKYDKIKWYHLVHLPKEALTGQMQQKMMSNILYLSLSLLLIMPSIAALFFRLLYRPINKLVTSVKKIENGEFGYQIEKETTNEFGYLTDQFNHMSSALAHLIQENYQSRLREKDTEIMSLTIQFNPHYLYNTLNAIHWVAMRGDARESADLIRKLALMMRYTSDTKQEHTYLRDDLDWMRRYLDLMKARYGDLFTVYWNVDEAILNERVPKLFLQPLVENCIVHAFNDIDIGGEIEVAGISNLDVMTYTVRDNGCGISEEKIQILIKEQIQSYGGLANVQRRIKLIYGEEYGIKIKSYPGNGTTVEIKMPKK